MDYIIRQQLDEILIDIINNPISCVYNVDTHNKAYMLLLASGFRDEDADQLVCDYMGGDSYARWVMNKAIKIRGE